MHTMRSWGRDATQAVKWPSNIDLHIWLGDLAYYHIDMEIVKLLCLDTSHAIDANQCHAVSLPAGTLSYTHPFK